MYAEYTQLLLTFPALVPWLKRSKGVYINKSRGGKYAKRNIISPPLRSSQGGQNLNCKFKTFGFLDDLDTLKVHIQSSYLASTTLSLLQTKIAEKNTKLIFICSSLYYDLIFFKFFSNPLILFIKVKYFQCASMYGKCRLQNNGHSKSTCEM